MKSKKILFLLVSLCFLFLFSCNKKDNDDLKQNTNPNGESSGGNAEQNICCFDGVITVNPSDDMKPCDRTVYHSVCK